MNAVIISIVILVATIVIVFAFIRNRKDKKNLVKKLNKNYRKPRETDSPSD